MGEAVLKDVMLDEVAAAEHLGIQPCTLKRWRYLGEGPDWFKLGRCVRYSRMALDEFKLRSARTPSVQARVEELRVSLSQKRQ